MLDLIYCEILKLKRAKIVLFSILGVLAVPFIMLAEALQTHFEHPDQVFTLADVYDSSLLYAMLLMNMMVYVSIAAYLFSREYSEKTLKTLLTVPVSRMAYITGKFIMLYLWMVVLTIVTWTAILGFMSVYHMIFTLDGYGLDVAVAWLVRFMAGSILMFLTISPFAYIAERTKGFVIPVIVCAVVVMGSAVLSNQEMGALYPWTGSLFLVQGEIQRTGYPILLVIGIIVVVSLTGFVATYRYFCLEDLK